MKTSELTGAALDWAVANAEGFDIVAVKDGRATFFDNADDGALNEMRINYSTDWSQGGVIIERENIAITGTNFPWWECDAGWYAHIGDRYAHGTTPLEAAMRCYVASKLGDEIELPEELLSCPYCGGDCPSNHDYACDGFLGDIDNLLSFAHD